MGDKIIDATDRLKAKSMAEVVKKELACLENNDLISAFADFLTFLEAPGPERLAASLDASRMYSAEEVKTICLEAFKPHREKTGEETRKFMRRLLRALRDDPRLFPSET